ncbi:MAG: cysteine dioxygenase family protein [Phormidesmis sp.]
MQKIIHKQAITPKAAINTVTPLPDNSIASYPESLQRLIRTLSTISPLTPQQLKRVIEDINVSAYDLIPWADFDHSPYDSYGRKMVFHGGHFEVMVMSWVPGDFSAIHDHGHAQWGAVQCFGEADHYLYTLEGNKLKNPVAAHYEYGDIHTVDHYTVHQMGNGGNRPFLSMHVYGCTQAEESITENARVFDLLEESIQYTNGGVFFGLPEHKIVKRDYGLTGDIKTTSMQYTLMRDRMKRMLTREKDFQIEKKLSLLEARISSLK